MSIGEIKNDEKCYLKEENMIYLVFFISIILAILAEKRKKLIYLIFLVIVMSLFIGLRGYDIGDDTRTYYEIFQYTANGVISPNIEYGFWLVSYLLLQIIPNATFVFTVFSFIINTCFVYRLWTMRERYSFHLMLIIYLLLFYPQTCNIMRQYIAISVIFLATLLLEKKRYRSFIIINLLMFTIHKSAIMGIFYIPIFMFMDSQISKRKKKNAIIISMIALPIVLCFLIRIFGMYSGYLIQANNSIGVMNLVRLLMIFLTIFSSPKTFIPQNKKYYINGNVVMKKNEFTKEMVFSTAFGVSLYFLGYYTTTLTRLGYYFGVYEIAFIAKAIKKGRYHQVISLGYFLILSYYFYIQIQTGWSELANYVFFFQR